MFPSFLLSLREGLEAALIIGVLIGVVNKIDRPDLKPAIWSGAASAVVFSLLAAFFLNWLGAEFEGRAEEIFEGVAMLLAAGLLTWMIFWMRQRASSYQRELETDTRKAAIKGGQKALFVLAFLAIGREGLELALFLFAASFTATVWSTVIGTLFGLGLSVFIGWSLFATTRRLNLRAFFQITSVLLILFAAGLVAHGVHEFNEAGLIPSIIEPVWDTNYLLDEDSTLGQLLKALFGYNGNPTLTEVIAYISYFALIWFGIQRWSNLVRRAQQI